MVEDQWVARDLSFFEVYFTIGVEVESAREGEHLFDINFEKL